MISETKYLPGYEISKEKALKIQAFMGFKPMTKYFTASKISKKNLRNINKRKELMDYQRREPTTFWLFWDSNP